MKEAPVFDEVDSWNCLEVIDFLNPYVSNLNAKHDTSIGMIPIRRACENFLLDLAKSLIENAGTWMEVC